MFFLHVTKIGLLRLDTPNVKHSTAPSVQGKIQCLRTQKIPMFENAKNPLNENAKNPMFENAKSPAPKS